MKDKLSALKKKFSSWIDGRRENFSGWNTKRKEKCAEWGVGVKKGVSDLRAKLKKGSANAGACVKNGFSSLKKSVFSLGSKLKAGYSALALKLKNFSWKTEFSKLKKIPMPKDLSFLKKFSFLLILEGLICVGYCLLGQALPDLFGDAVVFPFRQIAVGLRALSLSGSAGNFAAIVLYVLFCLLPAGYLGVCLWKRDFHWTDSCLILLTLLLFPAMYLFINPQFLPSYPAMDAIVGVALYSLLFGYVTLRVVLLFFRSEDIELLQWLNALLGVIAALLVLKICGTELSAMLRRMQSVRESNPDVSLWLTDFFLILRYIFTVLPDFFCCILLLDARGLLKKMHTAPDSPAVVKHAHRLSVKCGVLLAIQVIFSMALNLAQLLLVRYLRTVDSTLFLPLGTMTLVLTLLLAARFIRSHKVLKDENDSFI